MDWNGQEVTGLFHVRGPESLDALTYRQVRDWYGLLSQARTLEGLAEVSSSKEAAAIRERYALMLAGGGIVNGSFLAAGLVDEFSLVVAPVADGGSGVASFAQADFLPHWPPAAFHLKSAQTPQPDVLWLRYTRP